MIPIKKCHKSSSHDITYTDLMIHDSSPPTGDSAWHVLPCPNSVKHDILQKTELRRLLFSSRAGIVPVLVRESYSYRPLLYL